MDYGWLKLETLLLMASLSLSISQVCGLWCSSLNEGAGPVLGPLSRCCWWEFWVLTCCWILVTLANYQAPRKRYCQTDFIKVWGNKISNKYIPKLFFNCYYLGCIKPLEFPLGWGLCRRYRTDADSCGEQQAVAELTTIKMHQHKKMASALTPSASYRGLTKPRAPFPSSVEQALVSRCRWAGESPCRTKRFGFSSGLRGGQGSTVLWTGWALLLLLWLGEELRWKRQITDRKENTEYLWGPYQVDWELLVCSPVCCGHNRHFLSLMMCADRNTGSVDTRFLLTTAVSAVAVSFVERFFDVTSILCSVTNAEGLYCVCL